jgi:ribosomal protein S18 acetylase RimI-like enzyme
VDPAGDLAAFCIGWFAARGIDGRPTGQIEPLGVRADVRRQGLGHAILTEGLQRLYALGAANVIVETDHNRDAALVLYQATGFQVREHVLVYRKDYQITDD